MKHDAERCRVVFALLSQYLDLELPPAHGRVRALGGVAESLRKTVELCRGYEPGEMPAPLSESARRQLELAWRRAKAARG